MIRSNLLKKCILASLAFGLSCSGLTFSAEQTTAADLEIEGAESEIPPGILPIPDYGGDIADRSYLTGDWGGNRTEMANHGFQFDVDSVMWTDTALDGGTTSKTHFGGNPHYNATLDLMRAGILPGAVLQLRAESRYGSSGNLSTGQLVPVNTAALSPTNYSDIDGGYDIALTQLSYLQLLSEQVGVIVGKLDLYGYGDTNEFATGRGRTHFLNWSLNYGTPNLFVPATTIGAGVVIMPSRELTIQSLLTSGTECTVSNCFNNLDDKGGISITTATYQYNLGGLPGGVAGAFIYLFDNDFTQLGTVAPVPGEGVLQGSTQNSSWIAGGSFWQYLSIKEPHEGGPLNLANGAPDLEGWGIFGRLTFADEDTNPWHISVAAGVSGRGVIPGRPNDVFGVGYFYNDLSSKSFILDRVGDAQGVEGFYSLAITPAVKFSTNIQYTKSARPLIDDTFLLSTRLYTVF
jgi:porin